MNFSRKVFTCLLLSLVLIAEPSAYAIDPSSAAGVFSRVANSPNLRDPSVALIDASTGEFVFESNSTSARKPASVMKVLSATATIKYLDSSQRYETKVLSGVDANSAVIIGQLDPWLSLRYLEGKKMHRTSVPALATAIQGSVGKNRRKFTVYYSGLYATDVANINRYFKKKRRTVAFKKVNEETAISNSFEEKLVSTSPTVKEITTWFLTWSDNVLAERMARFGVSDVFKTILTEMNIDSSALNIHDASGLSKENRITAHLMGELLFKIHKDPAFSTLIAGLPVSGQSGTLRKRYLDTAPEAVGLVKAKTGTLNGTVSLAGYIESGDREYIFVVIADKIARGTRASDRARQTLDSLLGQIAAPLMPTPVASIDPVATVVSGPQTP
jgi:D-alanyl-D-alanine carboxypeptidase